MKILVVSEGKHELNLDDGDPLNGPLVRLIARTLSIAGEPVHTIERRPVKDLPPGISVKGKVNNNYQRKAMQWVLHAKRDGFDALVLVVDQDRDPDRRIGLDAAQTFEGLIFPRAMGLAVKSFDAWLLADEQAISRVTGRTIPRQKAPETVKDPKETIGLLIVDLPETRTQAYLRIAEEIDLDMLAERCPEGFGPFRSRLQAMMEAEHGR